MNWMRLKVSPVARANVLAKSVFPTPGTSSRGRAPRPKSTSGAFWPALVFRSRPYRSRPARDYSSLQPYRSPPLYHPFGSYTSPVRTWGYTAPVRGNPAGWLLVSGSQLSACGFRPGFSERMGERPPLGYKVFQGLPLYDDK